MSVTSIPCKLLPLTLAAPHTHAEWFEEPALLFTGVKTHIDPKTGIPLYGPRSFGTPKHKSSIHVGFIGTVNAVAHAQTFLETCTEGIDGSENQAPFPGCSSDIGF